MSIQEDKNVTAETYPYIFPDVDMKIQSVFRRRNKTVIPPNIAMLTKYKRNDSTLYPLPETKITSAPTPSDVDTADFMTKCRDFIGENYSKPLDTKQNASSTFVMNASENQLFRLQDAEINLIAQYGYYDAVPDLGEDKATTLPICKPMFGNQCLLSLFQMIELRIDGVPIERNAYPGFSSNMDYALRYPHCKTLEKDYQIHGFVSTDPKKYVLPAEEVDRYATTRTAFDSFDQQGITCQVITQPMATTSGGEHNASTNKWTKSQVNFYTGFINQRYKLSDIFTCVKDMPTIFNHKVEVVLQRASHDDIICNTFTASNVKCRFLGFWSYQLFQYVSETTNELSDYAKAYYSKPIETIIQVKKDVQTPFIQQPTASGNITFNLGVDPSFKNCLLTLCIPRTAQMNGQFNSNRAFFTRDADGVYTSTNAVDNSASAQHYDVFYAPCNSYTSGGLKFLTVSNNGTPLYNFTMEDDGTIRGPKENFRLSKPNTQMNYTDGVTDIRCANYQDVYVQYLRAREHFEQPECEALDFNTFMKEYCFFCIDLSPFEINANQQITITMGFSTWSQNYNPYYDANTKLQIGGLDSVYRATQIISNIYCMKILRLNPGRTVGVFDVATTTSEEVQNKISI